MNPHPSYLLLDRHALGDPLPDEVAQHVAGCQQCQAHLETVRALDAEQSCPAWLQSAERASDSASTSTSTSAPAPAASATRLPAPAKRTPWASVGATLALAAAAALALIPPSHDAATGERPAGGGSGAPRVTDTLDEYSTVRGAPSVGLYLRRGGDVELWDRATPLRAGDGIRVSVAGEAFTHVTLFLVEPGRPWQRLYDAALVGPGPQLLPRAWQLDDSRGGEALVTVLSRAEPGTVTAADAEAALAGQRDDLWAREDRLRSSSTDTEGNP